MVGLVAWAGAQLRPVRTDPSSWAVREELHTAVSPAPLRSLAGAPARAAARGNARGAKAAPARHASAPPRREQPAPPAVATVAAQPAAPGDSSVPGLDGTQLATAEPLAVRPEPARPRPRPPAMPDCTAELRLVGSAVNEARPALSRAVVRNLAGAFLLGIGGRIDAFTLVSIEPTRAALRGPDGELCGLSGAAAAPALRVEAPAPTAPAPVEAHPEPKGKPVFSKEELATGVRALRSGEYAVSRQLLLKAMTNPGGAAGGAWFRPFKRDGQSVGMEVRAVREGTALKAMGIETGDVARTVNGIALDNPQGLLAALRAVRESDTITIGILRNGQARDMRYLTE